MRNTINLLLTIGGLLLITFLAVLYSEGWRIDTKNHNTDDPVIKKTGMIAVRSIPDGAKIYLNDEAKTATDNTIASLNPGKHKIKIEREGYEIWEKEVEVYPELVTDITAVLVLQSPKLEPLTNTDVKAFALSENQNQIAYLTKNHEQPGVWLLPLTGVPVNLFRNESKPIILDDEVWSPSLGEKITWSPNDKEILIQMNESGYLMYQVPETGQRIQNPISLNETKQIYEDWDKDWRSDFLNKRIELIENSQEIPDWIMDNLLENDTKWSPDDEKFFFFTNDTDDPLKENLIVYNAEDPLPVDERRIYYTLNGIDRENTSVYWYSDSYHLILVKKMPDREKYYTIELIRIDGSNPTVIYTGELETNQAFPTPSGDKIIVLTTLKDGNSPNLYAIALR